MKNKILCPLSALILLFGLIPAGLSAQTNSGSSAQQFAGSWKQVDSLAGLGQPRSALEIVEGIYNKAKAAGNDPQVIKAIIYRIRLNSDFQENVIGTTIAGLKKEISASSVPATQILQSVLAEVYLNYYQNNQYRYRNRTQVTANLPDSVETWDLATIYSAIVRTYLQSLENAESLQKIPITKFDAIVEVEVFDAGKVDTLKTKAEKYLPTVYDFLADRALDFFTSGITGKSSPAVRFEVDQPWYFDQPAGFSANRMMIPGDSAAPSSFAMRIYRDLATFHLKDKDPRALIETELKRMAFVHSKYLREGNDSLYLAALKQFEKDQATSPHSASISFSLASFLNGQGQEYQPLVSDMHKWDIRDAIKICDNAARLHPGTDGAKNCKILAASIREPYLQVVTESAVPTDKPSLALISARNLTRLSFRLVKIDPDVYAEKSASLDLRGMFGYLSSQTAYKAWTQSFPDDGDFQKHQAEVPIPEVPAGFWVLLCSSSGDFSGSKPAFAFTSFWSTQISYVSKRNDDGSYSYTVLDRESGLPLKNVRAEVWEKTYNYRERQYTSSKLQEFVIDDQGYFEVPPEENIRRGSNQFVKLYRGDKDFLITGNFYQHPVYRGQERTTTQTMFYTDRSVYRPGQTVYFKGIIVERTGEQTRIKTNQTTTVTFTDANGQKVSEQTLTSNSFGSVSGSFVAPAGVLPGQMTIYNESGSTGFSVEEYKRPTFDVSGDPLEGNYKLGSKLTVTGKALAYAGHAIDGATVQYRVVRMARFPFRDWMWRGPHPSTSQTEIVSGVETTDAEGKFRITFTAIPDQGLDKKISPVFDYTLYVDVTDLNGETQSTEQIVTVGYKSLLVGADIPENLDLDKDTLVKITTTNLNARHTPSKVTITLLKLRQPDQVYISRSWERPDRQVMTRDEFRAKFPGRVYEEEDNPATWVAAQTVFEKVIHTLADSLVDLRDPATRIPGPGAYMLILKATDPFGEPVEVKKLITAFDPGSKEIPVKIMHWFMPLKTEGEPGEKARFLIGSAEDNVNVISEVRLHDSLVSREMIKLSNRVMAVEIPIKETYRGNFSVNFMFVKHNRVFQNSQVVTVPRVSRKLDVSFETFRSKLEPGAKETWKIKVSGPGGKPANAELMAGMYDASLDLFRPHEWTFNLYQRFYGLTPWDTDDAFRTNSGQWNTANGMSENYIFPPALKLNWFGSRQFGGVMRHSRFSAGAMDKGMRPAMMDGMAREEAGAAPSPAEMKEVSANDTTAAGGSERPGVKIKPVQSLEVRRDFRETAFFYPTLETDSSGSVTLQFTVPESLTRWNFMGMAHSQSLDHGFLRKEVVTRKDLMVFPNVPRFVRQGDTVIFSTKIVNLADQPLSGKVSLGLFDGFTFEILNTLIDNAYGNGDQVFTVQKGQSAEVSWRIMIPEGTDLTALLFRVTAQSGSFSDGEEKAVPVLTNRMLVTESLPLPVSGKGTFDFTFDKLVKSASFAGKEPTLKNYRLTLEFATNPAWYAIQALPALNDRRYENADAIFAAYWSNSMAAHIANSDPGIKAVFESWKNLTPDALQSNLAKNQQLKSALLQETPWVVQATTETGRKQRLGLFFDHNTIAANLEENLRKLQKLQTPNGGWTWFAGMPENRYITQNILTGMGKLFHLGIKDIMQDPVTRAMVMKAVAFLDGELQKDYEKLKRYAPKDLDGNHIGSAQVQYLYARSYFMTGSGSRIPDPAAPYSEAFDYYKGQAEKYWLKNDQYLQGMIALALNRLGGGEVPALIMKSLSERALHSNELGMYWAGERGYYWYQAPIETQALMIEAFDEVANDQIAVEKLKIWLLKQKQTQDWRSTRATLEACYALLLRGTDLLTGDPGVKITLGKEKISPDKLTDVRKEAGTGYFQVSWSGSEIKPEMGNITVSKSGEGVAWGAVYWQYFENLDKITPAATPLHLEKKLFLSVNKPSGPVLEPITHDKGSPVYPFTRSLNTGDKLIVRIVLTVDRDLEYVHMKDMRASALEPTTASANNPAWGGGSGDGLSGYRYQDGLGYYQSTTDQATNFFFDYLPKGVYVFEYPLKVNAAGEYSNGITTVQCMYAPEFTAHSEGVRIRVK